LCAVTSTVNFNAERFNVRPKKANTIQYSVLRIISLFLLGPYVDFAHMLPADDNLEYRTPPELMRNVHPGSKPCLLQDKVELQLGGMQGILG
jgi:hypothetical protein